LTPLGSQQYVCPSPKCPRAWHPDDSVDSEWIRGVDRMPGMTAVQETKLPGVGVRHEFVTADGSAVAVIVHYDGRREIVTYDSADPDACHSLINLNANDTQTLAELLGVSHVTERVDSVRQSIEHLALDWLELPVTSSVAGMTIGSGEFRSRTGASIVAVMRNDTPIPAPEAGFVLEAGDILVAVGDPEGLTSLRNLLAA